MITRARRVVSKAVAAPVATIAGLAVLPPLHYLLVSGRLQTATLVEAVEARTNPQGNDQEAGQKIADAIYLGARLWRLDDTSCVARSVMCWALCRQQGIDAVVQIGMAPEARKAHALSLIHISEPTRPY